MTFAQSYCKGHVPWSEFPNIQPLFSTDINVQHHLIMGIQKDALMVSRILGCNLVREQLCYGMQKPSGMVSQFLIYLTEIEGWCDWGCWSTKTEHVSDELTTIQEIRKQKLVSYNLLLSWWKRRGPHHQVPWFWVTNLTSLRSRYVRRSRRSNSSDCC